MKKFSLLILFAVAAVLPAKAQKVGFINTDSVMVALPEYQAAVSQLDAKANQYKQELEASLKVVEQMYNSYQSQKSYLSSSQRASIENEIINKEQQVKRSQDAYFGAQGEMAKASEQLLAPIRQKVSDAVAAFSLQHGYSLVIDLAVNAGIIYKNEADDLTKAIINILK